MTQNNKQIALVGPLPPPVHGFSNVTGKMLALLNDRAKVAIFDRAWGARGRKPFSALLLVGRFFGFCCSKRRFTLYVALSGGNGQVFDCLFILVARLFRQRIFVHHHSFAYALSSTAINRLLFRLVRRERHIALSHGMADALTERYCLERGKMRVVPNAAFFDQAPYADIASKVAAVRPVQIGFLSNITFDKGILEFFAVLDRLRKLDIEYRALIAGPVSPSANQVFYELLKSASGVEYLGPLYGSAKDEFYANLDIFLFPTKYVNEADPLVIHEALRNGVYVIACERGAIAETLGHGAGLAVPHEGFVECAVECVGALSVDRDLLRRRRQLALEQARNLRTEANTSLDGVLEEITESS